MKNTLLGLVLISGVLLSAACAAGSAGGGGSREVLTAEEIQASGAGTAYEAVQSMRPIWLRRRGQQTIHDPGNIVVYLDDARMGGPEALRAITAGGIQYIRFFDAAAANYRWGAGHLYGAIYVSTRPR